MTIEEIKAELQKKIEESRQEEDSCICALEAYQDALFLLIDWNGK